MQENAPFRTVGIGASAGGIPALKAFFAGVEPDSGMAYVVVTHLSPARESRLHDVIGHYTKMPVLVAEDGARLAPDHVYVLPQGAFLEIESGCLKLHRIEGSTGNRKPIDVFFASLAADQGENAVGVVLSGGDGDGTLGIKAIKEHGGLTLAQGGDGDGPLNPDMPRSAIASGLVDLAVPAGQMAPRLVQLARDFDVLAALEDGKPGSAQDELHAAQSEIYAILRKHSGHDFSGYKPKTLLRRVNRRMQVYQVRSLQAYIERLNHDPAEVMNLFRDLLINVTIFFRDETAFAALEKLVIPKLFDGRGADETIRVWVPGCSTGEEVYSIAILLREHMARLDIVPRVQIFATDIDEPALSVARTARYPEPLLEGVSEERRQLFFTKDGSTYTVAKAVRELCIFSPHNVIYDPPFSRMDMVSCRNLLIYFGPDVQKQVIPTFHYSLKSGGYLFLGSSENISKFNELFAAVDRGHRIFQSREHIRPVPRLPMFTSGDRTTASSNGVPHSASVHRSYPLRQVIEAHVLERFSPPHVVVNAEGEIVYYSSRTSRVLELPQGAPSRQLLTMVRRDLRLDLRNALREASETQQLVVRQGLSIEDDERRVHDLSLTIEPLPRRDDAEALYLVVFDLQGVQERSPDGDRVGEAKPDTAVQDLERDISEIRERMQSTIEEYETAMEELKSSNEELVSLNEESQSTNEELEASKEEMQSLNEELNTINAELVGKVEELDRVNSDLKNLFESTQIATVFLDRHLVIRNFTPAASQFFKLRRSDIGRPLTDLSTDLDYSELKDHLDEVFKTGKIMEHRLPPRRHDEHFLARVAPYWSHDSRIEGVVVTLLDVTTITRSEQHQKVLVAELNHRVKNMLSVVISIVEQTLPERAATTILVGRLAAMAKAYALLSREQWRDAPLTALIHEGLDVFDGQRLSFAGPDVRLKPKQSLAVAMVLHEMATNATKHGALSTPDGRVTIRWSVSKRNRFSLEWKEAGGPDAGQPSEDGFGLRLIRGQIEYQLGGEVTFQFRRPGLLLEFSFPLDHKEGADG